MGRTIVRIFLFELLFALLFDSFLLILISFLSYSDPESDRWYFVSTSTALVLGISI